MTRPNKKNSSLWRTVFLLSVLAISQVSVAAACEGDWISVEEYRDNGMLELVARNVSDFPITYLLRIRANTSNDEPPKSMSGTLNGQESKHLMELPAGVDNIDALSISCRWTLGSRNSVHDDDHHYLLPYASGKSYRVLQGYGSRFSHRGDDEFAVDFKMEVGTPVHAARSGVVARIEESHNKGCWKDGCGKFANFIVVLHDDGTTGEYYHLQQNGALVNVGDRVAAGQEIGLSGNTGHTALPHLHFAVYKATSRARFQSIPVTFISANGVIFRPRSGQRYLAITDQKVSD